MPAPIRQTGDYLDWLEGAMRTAAASGMDMNEVLVQPIPRQFCPGLAVVSGEYRRSVGHLFPGSRAKGSRPWRRSVIFRARPDTAGCVVAVSLGLHGALLAGIGEADKRSGDLLPTASDFAYSGDLGADLAGSSRSGNGRAYPRALRAGRSSSKRLALPLLLGASHLPSRLRMFRTVTHQAVPTGNRRCCAAASVVQPAIGVDRC